MNDDISLDDLLDDDVDDEWLADFVANNDGELPREFLDLQPEFMAGMYGATQFRVLPIRWWLIIASNLVVLEYWFLQMLQSTPRPLFFEIRLYRAPAVVSQYQAIFVLHVVGLVLTAIVYWMIWRTDQYITRKLTLIFSMVIIGFLWSGLFLFEILRGSQLFWEPFVSVFILIYIAGKAMRLRPINLMAHYIGSVLYQPEEDDADVS